MGLVSLYSFAICRDFSEFVGVSVKELVKAIGESRANGNGPTPPETPRRLSRSSSPKNPQGGSPRFHSPSSSPVPIPGTYTFQLENRCNTLRDRLFRRLSSLFFSFFFLTCDLILNLSLVHSRVCLTSHFWHRNFGPRRESFQKLKDPITRKMYSRSNGYIVGTKTIKFE